MKKYGYVVLAAIAAVLVSLGFSSSAQAYPDARIDLSVNHQVIYAGDTFTVTASSTVPCALDVTWNDEVRHGPSGKTFATSYVAPAVSGVTKIPLTGACQVTEPSAGEAVGTVTLHRKLTVTVLPRSDGSTATPADNSADLPGTGGPNRVFLLSGLVLVLIGATAVTVARRRAEEVELPGQTA